VSRKYAKPQCDVGVANHASKIAAVSRHGTRSPPRSCKNAFLCTSIFDSSEMDGKKLSPITNVLPESLHQATPQGGAFINHETEHDHTLRYQRLVETRCHGAILIDKDLGFSLDSTFAINPALSRRSWQVGAMHGRRPAASLTITCRRPFKDQQKHHRPVR
jgi:hypothetical protein